MAGGLPWQSPCRRTGSYWTWIPARAPDCPECAEVARLARAILEDMGLDPVPVTSGSKGIHLYAALDGTQTSDQVSDFAHELARALEADHPDLAVSDMKKTLRTGKVLVDWSQNNAAKTTIVPYSLRGRLTPTVAAPRTWRELSSPSLRQLDYEEVMRRVAAGKDPFAVVDEISGRVGAAPHGAASGSHGPVRQGAGTSAANNHGGKPDGGGHPTAALAGAAATGIPGWTSTGPCATTDETPEPFTAEKHRGARPGMAAGTGPAWRVPPETGPNSKWRWTQGARRSS